jgi:hypothetical protein
MHHLRDNVFAHQFQIYDYPRVGPWLTPSSPAINPIDLDASRPAQAA